MNQESSRPEESLLDLPLGEVEEKVEEKAPDRSPAELPPPRRHRGGWLTLLLLAIVAAAVTGYFWPRPAPALAGLSISLVDFGEQRRGVAGEAREVALRNQGERPLTVSGILIEGESPGDFHLAGEDCSDRALAADDFCTVNVSFEPDPSSPDSQGRRTAVLRIVTDAANGSLTLPLIGTPVAPRLVAEPSRLDFGELEVGAAGGVAGLVLANRGSAEVEIQELRLAGSGAAAFTEVTDRCSWQRLAPGETCRLRFAFAPIEPGDKEARLEIRGPANDGGAGVEIEGGGRLVGTALEAAPEIPPRLAAEEKSLSFGSRPVGADGAALAAGAANAGGGILALAEVSIEGPDAGAFSRAGDSCSGARLEAGDECAVEIDFRPRREGRHRASLEFLASPDESQPGVSEESSGQAVSIELEGVGLAPRLGLDRDRLDFGRVRITESSSRSLFLSNTGSAPLTLGRVRVEGPGASDFRLAAGGCHEVKTLPAGGSCSFELRFRPSSAGEPVRRASLVVAHSAASRPQAVELRGRALPPAAPQARIEPSRLAFGERGVGARSAIRTVTLSNPGSARLRLKEVAIRGSEGEDFQLVPGSCDGLDYLAPGGDCSVGLRFIPTAPGPRRARLRLRHDAAGGETSVELAGRGVAR